MRVNATAGGGGDDLVQREVNARNLDRFEPHGGVIPYSCMDVITVLRKSLKDVVGYKNICLTKSLRPLVLGQGLCFELAYGSVLGASVFDACGLLLDCLLGRSRVVCCVYPSLLCCWLF